MASAAFDDVQSMFLGEVAEGLHLHRSLVDVHGQDGLCPGGDAFSDMFSRHVPGVRIHVHGDWSAPALRIAVAHEMMVKVGRMTSSPCSSCRDFNAQSSAPVPLLTAMACLRPKRSAILFSNSRTNGPSEEIHPVSIHSMRSSFSSLGFVGYLQVWVPLGVKLFQGSFSGDGQKA